MSKSMVGKSRLWRLLLGKPVKNSVMFRLFLMGRYKVRDCLSENVDWKRKDAISENYNSLSPDPCIIEVQGTEA